MSPQRCPRAARRPTRALATALALGATLVLSSCGGGEDEPAAPGEPSPNLSAGTCPMPDSFFCTELPDEVPLDPQSDALVRQLRNQAYGVAPQNPFDCARANLIDNPAALSAEEAANCQRVTGRAGIAFDDFAPMLYTVEADQPKVPVTLDLDNDSLERAFADGVPIPPEAEAAPGTDGQLVVYQPSTDTMWEFWRAYQDPEGAWHASWGGKMEGVSENPGHFEDVVDGDTTPTEYPADGIFDQLHTWGGPASSIPNLPGLVTVEQFRSGEIGHALVFATWVNKPAEWVYPAQRTDGGCKGDAGQYCSDIPQGARFRVDPDFDTTQIANPVTRMLAEAAQDYGMVLNNSTGGGFGFYAEGWRGHPDWEDPYYGEDGLFLADPAQGSTTLMMRDFPWEALQMIQRGTTCTDASAPCPAPEGWANGTFADAVG